MKRKAQVILEKGSFQGVDYSKKSVDYLINELHVHQVELEIQNEELRLSHNRLEQSRDRFFSFFQNAPVGYLIQDSIGMIMDVNQTFCRMVGKDPLAFINKPVTELIDPADKLIFYHGTIPSINSPKGNPLRFDCPTPERGHSMPDWRVAILLWKKKPPPT
ncbi:MAG: PAS domain-containing protein [Desulfobacteraceae bacterium]|nr:MAG: PAS domain-containing protein [Desulfobacteraceae bacterium]